MKKKSTFFFITIFIIPIILVCCVKPLPKIDETIQWEYDSEGFIRFCTNDPKYHNYLLLCPFDDTYQDPFNVLEVECNKISGNKYGGYGVFFNMTDWDNYYLLLIDASGYYCIYKTVNGTWEAILDWDTSRSLYQGHGIVNSIKIKYHESLEMYEFSFNGGPYRTFKDANFINGYSGFCVSVLGKKYENFPREPVDVRFNKLCPDSEKPQSPSPPEYSFIYETTPLLDWEDIDASLNYRIQICENADFSGDIIAEADELFESEYQLIDPLENNQTYYWRIKILHNDGRWRGWSKVWNFSVKIGIPVSPAPRIGQTIYDTKPLLQWRELSEAQCYHIQICDSPAFSGYIIEDMSLLLPEYQVAAPLALETNYYWRVRILNKDNIWGDWSNNWYFNIIIGAPSNPIPRHRDATNDTTPMLSWDDVPDSQQYHLQVNTEDNFTGLIIVDDEMVYNSQYQLQNALERYETYYWRVRSKHIYGEWGPWSETWNFMVHWKKWDFSIDIGWISSVSVREDGTVYVTGGGKLYAIDPNGAVLWEYAVGESVGEVAVGSDGTAYFGAWDDCMYAINPDGTLRWKTSVDGARGFSCPAFGPNNTLHIGSDEELRTFDLFGVQLWANDYDTWNESPSPPAVTRDGIIYESRHDGLTAVYPDGEVYWTYTNTNGYISCPVAIDSDGTIYGGTKALNPDGTEKWTSITGSKGPVIGPDGTLYYSTDHGLRALYPDGSLKWEYVGAGFCNSHPAVAEDGTIFVGSEAGQLHAINPDGTKAWDFSTSYYVRGSITIGPYGTVYIIKRDTLIAFEHEGGGLADSPWPMYMKDYRHTGLQE
jgi:hypothetical protein